ncbi:hypothetical protein TWF718_010229 [Orbilia javanica]|uniref:Uncharacterized protein n=1 Tax=Orbilia javanica TaxID=47235 RepID=A0AAN8R9W0_9PEZI
MAVLKPFRGGTYYLWKYLPNVGAAVVFCLLFLATTGIQCWQIWKTKKTRFCIPFAIGGFCQFVGYAARASAYNKTDRLMPFCIQNTFILIAPVFYAASVYMTLGRTIIATGCERYSLIKPTLLTKIFVTGDVVTLAVQAGAAGMMVVSSVAKAGQWIVVVGLILQVLMFASFAATAFLFHRKMRANGAQIPWFNWSRVLWVLYAISALILIRSIFRVIEFVEGQDGYLLGHEWTLYIFDSLPMFAVMVMWSYWFPSDITASKVGEAQPLDTFKA